MSAALALWDRVFDADAPDWETDGRDWPNRAASRFVTAGGLRFHVQVMGAGPVLLLLHGTGAATHSWRALAPLLARDFTVIAPDLPGHGFTAAPFWPRMSLPGMAGAIATLLDVLEAPPALVAGHSAGAALMMMANWDLAPLAAALPRLAPSLLLIVGTADRSIPPADAREIARRVAGARVIELPRLGHLAHEEAPERVAGEIAGFAREIGVLAA